MDRMIRAVFVAPVILLAACAAQPKPAVTAAATQPAAAPAPAPKPASAEPLVVDFRSGSAVLSPKAGATLDHAARLFRAGNPVVMVVAGYSDATGKPYNNLILSAARANTVRTGLVSRGIPANRLQMQAFGESDPANSTNPDAGANRRVLISWH